MGQEMMNAEGVLVMPLEARDVVADTIIEQQRATGCRFVMRRAANLFRTSSRSQPAAPRQHDRGTMF